MVLVGGIWVCECRAGGRESASVYACAEDKDLANQPGLADR